MNRFGRLACVIFTVLLATRLPHQPKVPPKDTIIVTSEKGTVPGTRARSSVMTN